MSNEVFDAVCGRDMKLSVLGPPFGGPATLRRIDGDDSAGE